MTFELSIDENLFNSTDVNRNLAKLGFNKERIEIKNRWFDVLIPSEKEGAYVWVDSKRSRSR